ncbi:MAG: fructose 1,6-bisphosphatase, partial [Bacillota bacterium]|nr:fructose 1,6-bisphosphatase [Bacillota bacterium]
MTKKITLSVIKADVGGFIGHSSVHPELIERARGLLAGSSLLIDFRVTSVGDDINLILTHELGRNNGEIHQLTWDTFISCTDVAKKLKLYGAGQDLLGDAFSGNIKGLGPGVAEIEIEERKSEPVIVFMADKTEPGAWNFPLYKMFADPFNTAGLVIAETLHQGFTFEIQDVREHLQISLHTPEEAYYALILMGAPSRYSVKRVFTRATNEVAAVSSTD